MTGAASNQMDVERDELPPLAPAGRHARRTGPSQLTWGSLTEPTVPPSSTSAVIATACVRRRSDSLCCDHAELDHGPCSFRHVPLPTRIVFCAKQWLNATVCSCCRRTAGVVNLLCSSKWRHTGRVRQERERAACLLHAHDIASWWQTLLSLIVP
jgi:hypothetical protein